MKIIPPHHLYAALRHRAQPTAPARGFRPKAWAWSLVAGAVVVATVFFLW